MLLDALKAIGGLGLFLLGMIVLRQGLQALVGPAAQRTLRRFTRSPVSGAGTGAAATVLVQSSSITTVAATGFASAGLLTFPEALGIVLGANVGTTITGWLVALLGFKLQLGVAMPLVVLVGVVVHLLGRGRGRAASIGLALAGFGLAFVGIDMLRAGTVAFEGIVTPDRFPGGGFLGNLQLVAIGIAITLITQSSSAGVATAIAAVAAGALHFEQAAAIVIGMDVGTTVTAALATLGASLPGRRTGWAHVFYNVLTGAGALVLLPLFASALDAASPGVAQREPELSLVAFHTFFNLAGLVAVLPFVGPFARLVERLVPDRPSSFTERLDRRWLRQPDVALRAIKPTLAELADHAFSILRHQLRPRTTTAPDSDLRELLVIALDEVSRYVAGVPPEDESHARLATSVHVIDELGRLLDREEQAERAETAAEDEDLRSLAHALADLLPEHTSPADTNAMRAATAGLRAYCEGVESDRAAYRASAARRSAADHLEPDEALAKMDAYRWLERCAHHAWRVTHHLDQLSRESPTELVAATHAPD